MSDQIIEFLKLLTKGLEIASAALLILGFFVATFRYLLQYFKDRAGSNVVSYRKALGRVVLIGLEVLVAATILKTITTDETLESLSYLAIMIIARTILSWSMSLEMNGRWPWQ
mgnify:CR=1 FL=1